MAGPVDPADDGTRLRRIIGRMLRAAREGRGWSLEDMVRAMGRPWVSGSSITAHESGHRALFIDRYLRYCKVLELPYRTVLQCACDEAKGRRNDDIVTVDLTRLALSGNPLASWAEARLKKLRPKARGVILVSRPMQDQLAKFCQCDRAQLIDYLYVA